MSFVPAVRLSMLHLDCYWFTKRWSKSILLPLALDPGKLMRGNIGLRGKGSASVSSDILLISSLFFWGWHLCYIINFPNEIERKGPYGS